MHFFNNSSNLFFSISNFSLSESTKFLGALFTYPGLESNFSLLSIEEINKPFRRSDCERVTSEFFAKLRRAYEDGKLIIHGRDEDFVN